jgi:uncharacterized protein
MAKLLLKYYIYTAIVFFIMPTTLLAASFDCSKAKTETEKAICSDSILSKLDDDLAVAYRKALKAGYRDGLKENQRLWLKEFLVPCDKNKDCIKKVYENRLSQLNNINENKKAQTKPGKIVSKTKPLKCAQCGVWQDVDIGIFVIDDKRIIIPGCGVFDYNIEKYVSKACSHAKECYTYKVSMLLKQTKTSLLCNNGDEKDWYLEADVSGHFQQGGTAEFILRKSKSDKPELFLSGWNIDREDPCDAGSGIGSSICNAIETSHVYRTLSNNVENAYSLLINAEEQKLPDFNVARFSASVYQFCMERERLSGANAWPKAWALDCQMGIMEEKYKEFVAWQTCMGKNENKLKSCKFPDESFDRSPKLEDEE